jgi:hypothetical protein
MRQNDLQYLSLLTDLRTKHGENIDQHIDMLTPRIISSHFPLDATDTNTTIIVLRNATRIAINYAKTKAHAIATASAQIVCLAIDNLPTTHDEPSPALREKLWHLEDNKCEDLAGMLSLVKGMPLIIKQNIATELGVCNGSTCTFSRLVMNPQDDQPTINTTTGAPHYLRFMPLMLIVKFDKPKFRQFEGLEVGEFPIFPFSKSFDSKIKGLPSVKRTQFPVLPAYAITGYAAQGATFEKAIIDLREPEGKKCGPCKAADAYVLLSRLKSLAGLKILRPFQKTALTRLPPASVREEILRLEELAAKTSGAGASS